MTTNCKKDSKNISTCGKHVIARILRRDLTTDQYNSWIRKLARKHRMTTDEVVCQIYEEL